MKVKEVLKNGVEILNNNNIEEPRNKARLILAKALNISKEKIILKLDENIEENIQEKYFAGISELINHRPIQYIIRKSRIYET